MDLPERDNPVWARMEDGIANERWPLPSPLRWGAASTQFGFPAAANVTQTYFECGYFEEGYPLRRGSSALVQGGCIYDRVAILYGADAGILDGGTMVIAHVDSVPTGTSVSSDNTWPQAYYILHGTQMDLSGPGPTDSPDAG
jgi:hypothetical protein